MHNSQYTPALHWWGHNISLLKNPPNLLFCLFYLLLLVASTPNLGQFTQLPSAVSIFLSFRLHPDPLFQALSPFCTFSLDHSACILPCNVFTLPLNLWILFPSFFSYTQSGGFVKIFFLLFLTIQTKKSEMAYYQSYKVHNIKAVKYTKVL